MFGNLYDVRADDPSVKMVIKIIQMLPHAEELNFEYNDGETEYGFPFHGVKISNKINGKSETFTPGLLVAYPQIFINELYIYGILTK